MLTSSQIENKVTPALPCPAYPEGPQALTPIGLFGELPVQRVHFVLKVAGSGHLPEFLGSAWRGVIGWEMQNLVCPFKKRAECTACVIRQHCPYFLLVEGKATLPGIADSPRGYVIHDSQTGQDNMPRQLDITLLGDCSRFLPVVAAAVLGGQERGLGSRRNPYRVESVAALLPGGGCHPLPLHAEALQSEVASSPLAAWLGNDPPSGRVKIRFLTPLRLRRQGKYLGEFDGPFFLETVLRRIETINNLYNGGQPLPAETRAVLREVFDTFSPLASDMSWHDQNRYSNSQHRKVPLGGLVGTIEADVPSVIGAWLQAASLVGVGKGANMGMGRVEVEEVCEKGEG